MSNTTLTADIIAKEALLNLENELGVLDTFYRDLEPEFDKTVNGYKVGDTVSVRRPPDFTIRTGNTMNVQDVIEGKVAFTVDTIKGVDFQFTSTDLTLKIGELGDRVIKPAIINLVHDIVNDCLTTYYKSVYQWTGTPGQAINSFADFAVAPQRMDEMAIPQNDRYAALSPADHWAMLGSQTALYIQDAAKGAYRSRNLGMIGGIETMMTQMVPWHTTGTRDNTTPLVKGASQNVTYDTAKNTWTQSLIIDGLDNPSTITEGDVFTIADCYMVNPKTKVRTDILQPFVARAAVSSTGESTLTISPPIITSGPHQTVEFTSDMDDNAITFLGSAATNYRQNLFYHKNAFGLCMVPLELPAGAVNPSRQTRNGISVRIIPVYDGTNNVSKWRLDVLYGKKTIDPRLAVRASGTA